MGFKTIPCKCPVCNKAFKAEAFQLRARIPCCSRTCEQERRHKASRDALWAKTQSLYIGK
ncbi:putative sulfurtransferase [Glaciimonas immobilis]|uniref:Putative sulfurtransferase n=1 Tax=Glaciimonas immobilis TaxID=728004 RepID=A0A840RWP0_9BURK|nr:putative sulfurtransferase [Glaciimonas immobilis]